MTNLPSPNEQQPDEGPLNEFDSEMAKPLTAKNFDKPFRLYGTALIDGQYYALSVTVDGKGKFGTWRQHYMPEVELEFAQDTLKKVLAFEGIRY